MKSLILLAVLFVVSISTVNAKAGAKSVQTHTEEVKIIRDWK